MGVTAWPVSIPRDTRAGTLELQIPKLRQGTYFLEWLLERALASVVATCYLLGVSTRRMDKRDVI
jgi:putative transposase